MPQPPVPADDFDRDPRTRQGNPAAMRCRICGASRVMRRNSHDVLYCPTCDHTPLRSKG